MNNNSHFTVEKIHDLVKQNGLITYSTYLVNNYKKQFIIKRIQNRLFDHLIYVLVSRKCNIIPN